MPRITSYKPGQFCWVDLMSPDTEASKEFYAQLFGWKFEDMPTDMGPPYTIFKLGDDEICGMAPLPPDMQQQGIPPVWNSYINVDDLEAVAARAESLGGTVIMPSMKVMEAGWMCGIMDPTGGRFFLWKKNLHCGAMLVNDPGCFCWNELATRDVEKARGFYGELFNWEFEENPGAPSKYYIIKNDGDMNGGLMQMDEKWPENVPSNWGVYFSVEDADRSCAKLKELGGEVCSPPFAIPPIGRIAAVSDPRKSSFYFFEFAK